MARVMTGTIVGEKTYSLEGFPGVGQTIPEVTPAPRFLQSLGLLVKDQSDLKAGQHNPNCDATFQAEDIPAWTEQPADWQQIKGIVLNEPHWNPAKRSDASTPAQVAWEFGVQLYCKLKLSTKNAYRGLLEWAKRYEFPLTHNKAVGILSNARSMACATNPGAIPINLWQTDRWQLEKAKRGEIKATLSTATKILRAHLHDGGWAVHGEHEQLSLRQLNNWDEGRARCGNSYWWIKYDSPGLEHLKPAGTTAFCKTGHACNSPGCAECALFESERETGEWDWEAAYGVQLPYILTLTVDYNHGPKELKQAVSKMVKRRSIIRLWDGCFGVYAATVQGYSLQLMISREMAESNDFLQTTTEQWGIVCSQLFGKFGTATLSRQDKPAIDVAIDLCLLAERNLFSLIATRSIDPQTGWNWFTCWIGNKPGAKGMNRVFHAPGWRKFALKVDDKIDKLAGEELSLNSELQLLTGNSAEEEEIEPERNFPRTWFSLESQVRKGFLLKAYDPYIQQTIYLDLGGQTKGSIPTEYVDPTTEKPIASYTLEASRSTGVSVDHGLSPQAKGFKSKSKSETSLPPEPEKFTQWAPATGHIPAPVDLWSTYSPEDRARAKGTFKGPKVSSDNQHNRSPRQKAIELTPAHFRAEQTPELVEQLNLEVVKKINPDHSENLLGMRFF